MRRLPRRGVGAVRGRGPHTLSRPWEASSPWPLSLTPAPAALPPPSPQTPPYMTPRAPRRSLSQLVSGPGSRAPPVASSSAGHRVSHLPSSPRIAPRRQSQLSARQRRPGSRQALRAGGAVGPAPSFREVCARLWRRCHRAWPEICRNAAESDGPLSSPGQLAHTGPRAGPVLPEQGLSTLKPRTDTLGMKTSQFL